MNKAAVHIYTTLCVNVFSFFLGKYLGMEWLVHGISFNFLRHRKTLLQSGPTILHPPSSVRQFQFAHIFTGL